jgi:hypothetical protein
MLDFIAEGNIAAGFADEVTHASIYAARTNPSIAQRR